MSYSPEPSIILKALCGPPSGEQAGKGDRQVSRGGSKRGSMTKWEGSKQEGEAGRYGQAGENSTRETII